MKRKMICLGVISLLLLIGVFSYQVGANVSDASSVSGKVDEQKNPGIPSPIFGWEWRIFPVRGGPFLRTCVTIRPSVDPNYAAVKIYVNDNLRQTSELLIKENTLFSRMMPIIFTNYGPKVGDPETGKLKVEITIGDWEPLITFTGNYRGNWCSWFFTIEDS